MQFRKTILTKSTMVKCSANGAERLETRQPNDLQCATCAILVRFGSIRCNSVQLGETRYNSVQLSTTRFNSVRCCLVQNSSFSSKKSIRIDSEILIKEPKSFSNGHFWSTFKPSVANLRGTLLAALSCWSPYWPPSRLASLPCLAALPNRLA